MKVLDNSPLPYVPSWAHRSDHLRRRMVQYRKRVEEQRKAEEELKQQHMTEITEWK